METSELYAIAERNNILIDFFIMEQLVSASVAIGSKCSVVINPCAIKLTREERVRLAHEIGHCMTGSFYNMYSNLNVRGKLEHEADKWAIKALVPKDELDKLIKKEHLEIWDLSDWFDVTEEFMHKVFDLYYEVNVW